MKNRISLLMVTKNAGEILDTSLQSVEGLVDEKIVVDDYSSDNTNVILSRYHATIITHKERDLGKQRIYGLKKCIGDWVLMLDSDEVVSPKLKEEIKSVLSSHISDSVDGYFIPYQNHFLGCPIKYGGEDYKVLRLFRREKATISENLIHEHVNISGNVLQLKHVILHYSYRSLFQMFRKFTDYARREAERKIKNGEKTTVLKPFTYGLHMFFSRYIKDRGYKDHISRIILDFGFGYMEFLTYMFMLRPPKENKKTS